MTVNKTPDFLIDFEHDFPFNLLVVSKQTKKKKPTNIASVGLAESKRNAVDMVRYA